MIGKTGLTDRPLCCLHLPHSSIVFFHIIDLSETLDPYYALVDQKRFGLNYAVVFLPDALAHAR